MKKSILFFLLSILIGFTTACEPKESEEDRKAYEDMELMNEKEGSFESVKVTQPITLGSNAQLGYCMASGNDFVAVGAPGYNNNRGAVLIYKLQGATLKYKSIIEAPADMPASEGRFGTSVAVSGNYLAIGGYKGSSDAVGTAYLYKLQEDGVEWKLISENLFPVDTENRQARSFGLSIGVSAPSSSQAGYIAVGAPESLVANGNFAMQKTGYVFIFRISPEDRITLQNEDVRPLFMTINTQFGYAVGVYNDDMIVGAPNTSGGRGAVFIYSRRGTETFSKTGGNEEGVTKFPVGSRIGNSVAIGDQYAIAGNGISGKTPISGYLAFMYNRQGYDWKSHSSIASLIPGFGSSVASINTFVMVGMPEVSRGKGAAYIFTNRGEEWSAFGGGFCRPERETGDKVGSSLTMIGKTVIMGAIGADNGKGAVYTAYPYSAQ